MKRFLAALSAALLLAVAAVVTLAAQSPGAANCTPIHDRLGDEWVRAEGTHWQGDSFDLIGGGSRVVGPDAMVSVGGTTYVIWPCLHGVGTS